MKLALRVVGLTYIERLVLAAIASHCDSAGRAWPGEELLAAETSLGLRSVRNAVRGLEAHGFVAVARRGRQLPNEYAIQVETLETQPRVTGTTDHVTGTTCRSQEPDRPASHDKVTGISRQSDRHLVPPKGVKKGTRKGVTPPAGVSTSTLLSEYVEGFKARHHQPPVVDQSRDARILAGLVQSHGEEAVKGALGRYLDSPDAFIIERGYSIPIFRARFTGLVISANGHDRRRVNAAWAGRGSGKVTL